MAGGNAVDYCSKWDQPTFSLRKKKSSLHERVTQSDRAGYGRCYKRLETDPGEIRERLDQTACQNNVTPGVHPLRDSALPPPTLPRRYSANAKRAPGKLQRQAAKRVLNAKLVSIQCVGTMTKGTSIWGSFGQRDLHE